MPVPPQLIGFFARYGHLLRGRNIKRGLSALRYANPRGIYTAGRMVAGGIRAGGVRGGVNAFRNRFGASGTQTAFPWGKARRTNSGFFGRALRSPTVRQKLRRRLGWEAGIVGTVGAAATGADYLARRQLGMLPPKDLREKRKKKKGR